jgi:hypothetical protein
MMPLGDVFLLYGGVNQYARLLGLLAMQGNTHFKNKIKTFNAYTLPKVHQLGGITRHTWHIV